MTRIKCIKIVEQLHNEYPDYTINWCIVACRYIRKQDIPNNLKQKYTNISHNLYGVNDYYNMLNMKFQFTSSEYIEFLNKIANAMFK